MLYQDKQGNILNISIKREKDKTGEDSEEKRRIEICIVLYLSNALECLAVCGDSPWYFLFI